MEFASEMIVKATMKRLKIKEVPTVLYPDGRTRPPHLRTWTDGWRHLRFLLLYSPRWLFFYPGIMLTILGMLISAFLLGGPRQIGEITSATWSPALQKSIALAFVQRDFTAPGSHVLVGDREVHVTALPFTPTSAA